MTRASLYGVLLLLLGSPALPQEISESSKVDFVRDVQPIFKTHCLKCHSFKKKKNNFRLDSKTHALLGGIHGKAILPGKGKESPLIHRLTTDEVEKRMPHGDDPLAAEQIEIIRRWIDGGAPWPDSASAVDPEINHWAYRKPIRAEPPRVRNASPSTPLGAGWVRNPVDAFIAAGHEARGLSPRPEAPKHVLLRRVYLDLIGLPPTRKELAAFAADGSSQAYEKVVDRLLDDPRYGERWGRHWMDVWRYSDWYGWKKQVRYSQPHIWRWRDWIIESLNEDKGYDRMVVEMLAGDELAPEDPKTLRATGFLVRNWYKYNRNTWLEYTIEHTAKAFLAATMNCGRCHAHFYDPITHEEYYRFRAFFEPHDVRTDRIPGAIDTQKDGLVRAFDKTLDAKTYRFIRGVEKMPDKTKELAPGVPVEFRGPPLKLEPVKLPRFAVAPHRRPFVIKEDRAASEKAVAAARKKIQDTLASIAKAEADSAGGKTPQDREKARKAARTAQDALPPAMMDLPIAEAKHEELIALLAIEVLEETGKKDTDEWKKAARKAQSIQRQRALLEARRALFADQRAAARAQAAVDKAASKKATADLNKAKKKLGGTKKALAKAEAESKKPGSTKFTPRKVRKYPPTSTGRRLALARWITSKENPLAARVAVNHIWMRHFGKPLVPSVFDFGLRGKKPTHPELLDWLSVEFMERNWSMKELHRLLVTSSTYRMDSTVDSASLAADGENRWFWRMNARRMEAELVRDSVLYVSGQLNLTRGGRDIEHAKGMAVPRRSVYFQHASEKQMRFLTLFDVASVNECYERSESIIPQQALAMANSSLVTEQSRTLARRLSREVGEGSGPEEASRFVSIAFEHVLGRPPTDRERAECETFLARQAERLKDSKKLTPFTTGAASKVKPAAEPHLRARESLTRVLLNHNEFLTIR